MMRRTLATAFLAASFGVLAMPQPAEAQRSGGYTVTGRNLDGTEYTGVAVLDQVGSASFTIVWQVAGAAINGVGMVSGHNFAVVYGAANQPGIGIYNLQPDGRLVGTWTVVGAQGTGSETLTPVATPQAATPPAPAPTTPTR
ncbi:hypothetical protein ACQW02_03585 [Humitalea sp. 24SJ18S-53]|uniref:hypothetical protein n=1 Tax=Humitalea sp. 24SJ18S-53 TaxID=3422307 RepID=UPI003D66E9DF